MRAIFLTLTVLLFPVSSSARKPMIKDMVANFENAKTDQRILLAPSLGNRRDKKTTDALINAFDIKRGNPRESSAIVDALGASGDPRAVAPLATAWDYLRSMILQMSELPGNLQVIRWKILEALSRIGGEQAVRTLSEALNENDPRVVEEAVRGLGRLQNKDAVPALQTLAGSATGNQLQAVFEALGDIGDKRAISTVEQAFTNPDKFIEVEAAYALAKLGKKDMVLRLQHFLNGDPGEDKVGILAAYYLVKLDKDSGLKYLEEAMKKPDSPLAPIAADSLGKSDNPRAVLVLVEAYKAPDPMVRLAVAKSLIRLGGGRSISALRKMKIDSNPSVRSTSLNGLNDLGESD